MFFERIGQLLIVEPKKVHMELEKFRQHRRMIVVHSGSPGREEDMALKDKLLPEKLFRELAPETALSENQDQRISCQKSRILL